MEYLRTRFIDELNEEGDIEIRGYRYPRHQVLEAMDPDACRELFEAWVDVVKQEAKQRATDFLRDNGCLDRFKALNKRIGNQNVVPFVGAGMSIASGFQPWRAFLLSLMADASDEKELAELLLSEGQFEDAAEYIEDVLGADVFAEEIESKLGKHQKRLAGPVKLLPSIFKRGAITTNFDHILPNAYKALEMPFKDTYCGRRLREACKRLGDEPHCLMRLHGDVNERDGRVLTAREYTAAYSEGPLEDLIQRIVGTRSFLFMGCSLATDRTHSALKSIKDKAQGEPVRHYAFLPLPPNADRLTRRAFLAQAEIHPIYYPADDHDQSIEDLLITILEGGPND